MTPPKKGGDMCPDPPISNYFVEMTADWRLVVVSGLRTHGGWWP